MLLKFNFRFIAVMLKKILISIMLLNISPISVLDSQQLQLRNEHAPLQLYINIQSSFMKTNPTELFSQKEKTIFLQLQ